MFEAVVLACLASAPEVCRAQLLPGYEAATIEICSEMLADRRPQIAGDPAVRLSGAPYCVTAGAALDVKQIAPGVFAHMGAVAEPDGRNGGDVANLGFVVGGASVAVIDTGGSRAVGEALWRAVRQVTDLPVSHVILTHMHPDHMLGAAAFEGTVARFVGHAGLPRAFADRQANYIESFTALLGPEQMIGTWPFSIDVTLDDTLRIDLGGRALDLKAWPLAHTGTDVTVFDPTSGTLFSGDLVFHLHAPALDGSLKGWRAALEALAAIPATRLVPGHGGPVLDWPEGAAPLNRYLGVLETDTRAAIEAGERLGDAVKHIAAREADSWQLFETYNPRNATVAFTELEWE